MFCRLTLSLLVFFSVEAATAQPFYVPWFTGPLLAPTPINMQPGHPAIEPTITIFNTYGTYDSHWKLEKQPNIWAINPLIDFQFGITDFLGVEMLPTFITNFQNGDSSTHLQDTVVLFGYQVSNDIQGSWVPDFRLLLQETFPTGKYQKLNPKNPTIDSTGEGSFQTGPVLAFQKRFFPSNHALSLRWSIGYLFPSQTHVKGFNTYGGGPKTKGKVRPGQTVTIFFSGEYSLNQRWVLSFDTEFSHQTKSHFSGTTLTKTTLPSSTQISFAPEVEYNFSSQSGLLTGLWFTLAGQNSSAFASAFLAYVYVF